MRWNLQVEAGDKEGNRSLGVSGMFLAGQMVDVNRSAGWSDPARVLVPFVTSDD